MFAAAAESVCFCFRHAPLRYSVFVICEILFSLLPFVVLYNWENILNTLSVAGVTSGVWLRVGLYVFILILQLLLEVLNAFHDKMSYETAQLVPR